MSVVSSETVTSELVIASPHSGAEAPTFIFNISPALPLGNKDKVVSPDAYNKSPDV